MALRRRGVGGGTAVRAPTPDPSGVCRGQRARRLAAELLESLRAGAPVPGLSQRASRCGAALGTGGAGAADGGAAAGPAEPIRGPHRRRRGLGLALLATFGGLLWRPAALRLARFDNLRLILLESAPLAAELVTASARLAPPEPLTEPDDATGCGRRFGCSGRASCAELSRPRRFVSDDRRPTRRPRGRLRLRSQAHAATSTSWLRAATVFEHAYCPTPHTSYSVTSLLTGKYMRPLLLQGAGEDSVLGPGCCERTATARRRFSRRPSFSSIRAAS